MIRLDTIENPTRNYCISNFKFKSLKEIFSQDKTKANSHNMIICKVSIERCSLSKLIHDQLTENTIAFFQDMIAINFRTKLTMTPVSILSWQRIILWKINEFSRYTMRGSANFMKPGLLNRGLSCSYMWQ